MRDGELKKLANNQIRVVKYEKSLEVLFEGIKLIYYSDGRIEAYNGKKGLWKLN